MRPLNKKYFGNRNIGTGGYQNGAGDDGIGGEGIYAINWSNSGNWLAVTSGQPPLAGLQLPAPTLPGGVQATWTVSFGIAAVTTGAGHTGLIAGETYTYAGFPGSIITVATVPGSGNATFTVTNPGTTTALLQDLQTVDITLRTGQGHTGVGTFTVDIFTKIVGVSINEKGSGYTGAEVIDVDLNASATGTVPQGTITLTTDNTANGAGIPQGNALNQENAIIINANTADLGNAVGDIIKQVNDTAFKVKTAHGTKQKCVLVATDDLNVGEAFIKATDSNGNTYFVTKITAHVATVRRWNNNEADWQFADGARAEWTLSTSPYGYQVSIENA